MFLAAIFTGCTQSETLPTTSVKIQSIIPFETINLDDLFSDRDYKTDYKSSDCITIQLGDTITAGKNVTVSGNAATITKEGNYLISGTLKNGMIIVDTTKDSNVQLILKNAHIHSDTSAPIYVKQADKVFITLDEGTTNTLSNGGSFVSIDENNIDSVIFSKDDLTLNGKGTLSIQSPGGLGIVSKDDLRITGGTYNLTVAGHGLFGRDAVRIADGNFTVQSGKDGIQSENDEDATLGSIYIGAGTFAITADGDGISAGNELYIEKGTYHLLCGGGSEYGEAHTDDMFGGMGGGPGRPGGRSIDAATTANEESTSSAKGLKSAGAMTIIGGSFQINSADEALHNNQNLTVAAGTFDIATGDDGFHADEALSIGGGTISITESYEGLEGLSITIAGGDITLKASDDGLNAAGNNDQSGFGGMGGRPGYGGDYFGSSSDSYILISGGNMHVDTDGDGIDANGSLTISGGYTVVEGPTSSMNGPLDYDGTGTISGGTIIASGSSGMAQSLTSTENQGILAFNTASCTEGTTVTITDKDGNQIFSITPQKNYSCIVISNADIVKGESYTIHINNNSGTFTAQ